MKITNVECLIADPGHRNSIFVRTHTDEGVHGVGEAYPVGPDLATARWIEYFAEQLVGEDPVRIEFLWAKLYQGARFPIGSSGMAALSAIDQTLWDITGKIYGVPVHRLLGGRVRDTVRAYLGVHWNEPSDDLAASARAAVGNSGLTAYKTAPLPPSWRDMLWNDAVAGGREWVRALREAVGPDVDIGLDAHAAVFEPARVLDLADALAEFSPMFMEEPLRMENRHAMAELRRKMPFALATGECLYTRYEFDDVIKHQAADILQPDVCIVGGMSEMRKVAAIAEAHDITIAPHNPMGPLATMVNIHFAAATPNFIVLEHRRWSETELSFVSDSPAIQDGHFSIPEAPGWGIDLVPDAIEAHPYRQSWHRGDRTMADGSVAYI